MLVRSLPARRLGRAMGSSASKSTRPLAAVDGNKNSQKNQKSEGSKAAVEGNKQRGVYPLMDLTKGQKPSSVSRVNFSTDSSKTLKTGGSLTAAERNKPRGVSFSTDSTKTQKANSFTGEVKPQKAKSNTKPIAAAPMQMSLDGTMIQVADEFTKKKRLERAASMRAMQQHLGLGGATIRPVWEQENDDALNAAVASDIPKYLKMPKTISIVGAPMSWGQPHAGTDHGPTLVHQAGLLSALKRAGWRVGEDKILPVPAPSAAQAKESEKYAKETGALAHNSSVIGSFLKTLSEETEKAARREEFVLTIGGDHSIACGSLAGILRARPDTGVIWVDAHADIHTPLTSETGNMHGMPVGILMADDAVRTRIPGFGWLKNGPRLRPEKIVYVGARDLDQAERRVIKSRGILCFTMSDVDRWGIGQVMDRAFKHLGNSPIHLSYDIDAVDAEYAPHTGTVVRGGFTFREANFIAEAVAETNRMCSMDLVEINPTLGVPKTDHDNETVQLGLTIIASAMGQRIL